MLVLSRGNQESVVLGKLNDVDRLLKVTVLGIEGGRVRLGFETGDDFPVQSWEVWERIRAGAMPDDERAVDSCAASPSSHAPERKPSGAAKLMNRANHVHGR